MDELDKKWIAIIAIVFFGCFIAGKFLLIILNTFIPEGLDLIKGMIIPIFIIVGLLCTLYVYTRNKYDH